MKVKNIQEYGHYLRNYAGTMRRDSHEAFENVNIPFLLQKNYTNLREDTDIILYNYPSQTTPYPAFATSDYWQGMNKVDNSRPNQEYMQVISNLELLFKQRGNRILILGGLPALAYCADLGMSIVKDNGQVQSPKSSLRIYPQVIVPAQFTQKEITEYELGEGVKKYGNITNGLHSAVDLITAPKELLDNFETWFVSPYRISQRGYLNYDDKDYYQYLIDSPELLEVQEPMIIANTNEGVVCCFDDLNTTKNIPFWQEFYSKLIKMS